MFKRRKKKKPGGRQRKTKAGYSSVSESDSLDSGSESEADGGEETEWAKKVEEALRNYIETILCRRDMVDEYFDNPPRTICESTQLKISIVSLTLYTMNLKPLQVNAVIDVRARHQSLILLSLMSTSFS